MAYFVWPSKIFLLLACCVIAVFAAPGNPGYGTVNQVPDDFLNDPARNLDYNQLIQRLKEGKSVVIDVREPEEIRNTGTIPTSVLIPLRQLHYALGRMSPGEFKKRYKNKKPLKTARIIFSCQSGSRSRKALATGYSLGYINSAHYTGGWKDWEQHQKH